MTRRVCDGEVFTVGYRCSPKARPKEADRHVEGFIGDGSFEARDDGFESYVMMVDGEMIHRAVVPQSYVDVIVATWRGLLRFLEEDMQFDRAQAA
jgi:hypothetical protein